MSVAKVNEDIYNKIFKTPGKETEGNPVYWLAFGSLAYVEETSVEKCLR